MKNNNIYQCWKKLLDNEKYREYFMDTKQLWCKNLEEVKSYININKKKPSLKTMPYLCRWITSQQEKYIKKNHIMKDETIYTSWTEFINDNKYSRYHIGDFNEERYKLWYKSLEDLKSFINTYEKLPNYNEQPILHNWLTSQKVRYKTRFEIMSDNEVYKTWNNFISDDKYKQYFKSNIDEWYEKFDELKKHIDDNIRLPKRGTILGNWISRQKSIYLNRERIMKTNEIYDTWTDFINNDTYSKYFIKSEEKWYRNLEDLKKYIDKNNKRPIGTCYLGKWLQHQVTNYKSILQIMQDPDIYQTWTNFINDPKYCQYFTQQQTQKDMSKPTISPKNTNNDINTQNPPPKSELSTLHQKYKSQTSQNLNTYFKENPEKWNEYHNISKVNEESFPEEEIPRNKMIKYLQALPGKKNKVIADLGCGFAEINQHFKDNPRFDFHNFDHHSSSELVVSKDIKNTELDDYSVDIAILSLAMWGRNCVDYLKESYRILDTGGTLLIAEPYKRWNKDLNEDGSPINKLVKVLEENNFTIIKKKEDKFIFIECRKN